MNRLQFCRSETSFSKCLATEVLHEDGVSLDFPYQLFIPEHFEARYAYPLFFWLHSSPGHEGELASIIPAISLRNYVAIGLRGTRDSNRFPGNFHWDDSLSSMQRAEEMVLDSIFELTSRLKINASKIFVGGHGIGGTIAQWIGLRNAEKIAGVVSLHGCFPQKHLPLARWHLARTLPVLWMYGESSSNCPSSSVFDTLRQVKHSGLNYQFVQFNCGDEVFTDMGLIANRFMMEIVNRSQVNLLCDSATT